MCVSEALQALESLTLEEAARDEGLYWEELEELNGGTAYDLNQNSLPLGSHVQRSATSEADIKRDVALETPSRAQLDTWVTTTVHNITAQAETDSRTKQRRSSLFHCFTPEELLVALSSTDDPATDQEVQPTINRTERHQRSRHQKSASHQGLRHLPAARTELGHRAVKSLDTDSRQLRSSHEDFDPASPSPPGTPARLRLYPVVKEQSPVILTRQERSCTLPRVDEDVAMGSVEVESSTSSKRPWTSNGTQSTAGRNCDPSSYNHDKKRDSWGSESLRRKQKHDGKGGWLNKMTDWLTVTEPSAQALKQHKKEVFRKAGISPGDPEAYSKLHIPLGEIPAHAIKPSGPGPEPEEVLKKELEERRSGRSGRSSRGTSMSVPRVSHSSSNRSKGSKKPVARSRAPDKIFSFN
jgi:hypothetical protein